MGQVHGKDAEGGLGGTAGCNRSSGGRRAGDLGQWARVETKLSVRKKKERGTMFFSKNTSVSQKDFDITEKEKEVS